MILMGIFEENLNPRKSLKLKFRDKSININEFSALCTALFKNDKGKPYPLDSQQISDLFMIFNTSGDGSMSMQEHI